MNVYASRIILVYTMYLTFLAQKLKILWQGIKLHKTGNCFKINVSASRIILVEISPF